MIVTSRLLYLCMLSSWVYRGRGVAHFGHNDKKIISKATNSLATDTDTTARSQVPNCKVLATKLQVSCKVRATKLSAPGR
jgi:hypothetical protein